MNPEDSLELVDKMAKVLITCKRGIDSPNSTAAIAILDCAKKSISGRHTLTSSVQDADIILFAEQPNESSLLFPWMYSLSPEIREKCFVYDSGDEVLGFMPGLYSSHRANRWSAYFSESMHYLSTHTHQHIPSEMSVEVNLLASFMGSFQNHKLRSDLRMINSPDIMVENTDREDGSYWWENKANSDLMLERYYEYLCRSKYIICPRGRGAGSMRLFEAMRFGKVPIIISDDWQQPTFLDFKLFSIFVKENQIKEIPRIIEAHDSRYSEMSKMAKENWNAYFSPERSFDTLVDQCIEIKKRLARSGFPFRLNLLSLFQLYELRVWFGLYRKNGSSHVFFEQN